MEISKIQMELANRKLDRMAAKLDCVAFFRGVPVTEFDKEHLVMICAVFANEYKKSQEDYFAALDRVFPSYIAGGAAVSEILNKPSFWRRLWTRF